MRFENREELQARINQELARCDYKQCVKLCELYLIRAGESPQRKHLPKKVNIVQMARNEISNRLQSYGPDYDVLKDI